MSNLSVSAVGSIPASSSSSSTALTDATKKKLQDLGLDPSKYNTEALAQAAISQAQTQQQTQKPQKPSGSKDDSIKTEVQDLASKIGVIAGNNDKITDILSKISDKISELQTSAGTDPAKLAEVNSYQSQYTTISSEIAQKEAAKNMTGATAVASYNKVSLGLS